MARERTPPEKKALELARDRRNVYGENDKSSRASIRRHKRRQQQQRRHALRQALHGAAATLEEPDLAPPVPGDGWRKLPDAPLAVVLRHRRVLRLLRALRPRVADDPALLDRLELDAQRAGLSEVEARMTIRSLRAMLLGGGLRRADHDRISEAATEVLQGLVDRLP